VLVYGRRHGQSEAERAHNTQDRREFRVAVLVQRFVEAFPADARVARNLRHATRPRHGADGFLNVGGIACLKRNPQIFGLRLGRVEVFGRIKRRCLDTRHLPIASSAIARSMSRCCG
jgi:hypothetical protein